MAYDGRKIVFTYHAEDQMVKRKITSTEAEALVKAAPWFPQEPGVHGEPSWTVEGGAPGARVRVAFLETTRTENGKPVKVIEILLVKTVIDVDRRK